MQIEFNAVTGYKTYERAQKRGEEVAESLKHCMTNKLPPRFLVVPCSNRERWVPAFYCGDVQGGPGPFLSLVNVCCFN